MSKNRIKAEKRNTSQKIIKKIIASTTLLILVCIIFSSTTLAQTITSQKETMQIIYDEETIQMWQTVELRINGNSPNLQNIPLSDYELTIKTRNKILKYSGELGAPITYPIEEEGLHKISIVRKDTKEEIDFIEFTTNQVINQETANNPNTEPQTNNTNNQTNNTENAETKIFTDKQSYLKTQTVIAKIEAKNKEDLKLYLNYNGISQRYLGDLNTILFIPQEIGTYEFILKDSLENEITKTVFEVYENQNQEKNVQTVLLQDNIDKISNIINLVKKENKKDLNFDNKTDEEKNLSKKLKIKNSNREIEDANLKIITREDDFLTNLLSFGTEKKYDLEIRFENKPYESLRIEEIKIGSDEIALGIEEVPKNKMGLDDKIIKKSFSIDPTGLDFTTANLRSRAIGRELWKCKAWSFEEQTCKGSWEKLMDLVPGSYYDLTITPDDPGFMELGLSTINTDRSIYVPNSTARITSIVLDKNGFLVGGASVTITITDPNNSSTVFTTTNGNVESYAPGIYFIDYLNTQLEGNYTIRVDSIAYIDEEQLNTTMTSQFAVMSIYDFDIIRDLPLTIDPWAGPFNATINIIPLNDNISNYSVTEVIPSEVSIISIQGASIMTIDNQTLISWANLSGNTSLSYQAQAPLITPSLLTFGKIIINYLKFGIEQIFEEFREWFIAVDPAPSTDTGIMIYADATAGVPKARNWTGAIISTETSSGLAYGSSIMWQKIRCMKNYTQCVLLTSDEGQNAGNTNDDINFVVYYTENGSWGTSQEIEASINGDQRNFDVECEDQRGNCIIVYEEDTVNNANFVYRIWNGTGLSAEVTIGVPGAGSLPFQWLTLYPKKGENTIGLVIQNNGGGNTGTPDIYAAIWNGTNFTRWTTITSNAASTGGTSDHTFLRDYDCAWDGRGIFWCAFGTDGQSWINFTTYNGTNWTSRGTFYNGSGSEVVQIGLCGVNPWSNFNHTNLGVIMCDSGSDVDGGIWNGTGFSKTLANQTPYQNPDAECYGNKATTAMDQNLNCAWERSGSQAIFTWADNGEDWITSATYTVASNSFSINNWSQGTQILTDGANDLRNTLLVPNPESDKIFLTYNNLAADAGCSHWTGSSWDGSGCNNSAVFETAGPNTDAQWNVFDWFRVPTQQPIITFLQPNNTITTITYSGITNPSSTSAAYNGTTVDLPPLAAASPIAGTQASSISYVNLSSSDDKRASSVVATSGGLRAYQSFNFSIPQSIVSMTSLVITHEGYATSGTARNADTFYIYGYNWSSDTYVLLATILPSSGDVTTEITRTGAFTDFIRQQSMYLLVEGSFTTAGGINARAEVLTDYISVSVTNTQLVSQNLRVNITAVDDNGIGLCEWILANTTGTNFTGLIRMSNLSSTNFINTTSISSIPDGIYNITAFCNDTGVTRTNKTTTVIIDNTAPAIRLYTPGNATNITQSFAIFSWNVTDLPFENMYCNVTINSIVSQSNILSVHGENTTKNITGITDGTHYWNVTCVDNAGNSNVSETRVFDLDTAGPVITLTHPNAGAFKNSVFIDFNFTATDAHTITNCTLMLDSTTNTTLFNIVSGSANNITISDLSQGIHRWNITCIDSFNFRTNSSTRNFTYDTIIPHIMLNTSNNIIFNATTPQLNYTVIDNIDTNLICNVTVNDVIENSNIASPNNTLIMRNISLVDGFKSWNVTCVDDAGNINTSINRIFQVISGPLVTLISPANATIGNGENINFTYNASDGNGIANCSFYFDGVLNQTNLTVINNIYNTFFLQNISEGLHSWQVMCYDTSNTLGASFIRYIISDKSRPTINLNSPANGQVLTVTPYSHNFTMIDAHSPNATCNITVDSTTVSSGILAYNNSVASRNLSITNGLHFWNVTCVDLGGNSNTSITRNFTVNVTFPITVTVVADKESYQEGEIAIVNITTRNDTNGLTATNLTLDYIYTNTTYTDLKWWNTSWEMRVPLYLNETQGLARISKAIAVNITIPYNKITSCANELRIVSDITQTVVAHNVIDGDDVTYCYVIFNATVSASASSEQNYHAYFNFSGAPAPNFGNLLFNTTLISDDFEDANINGWTADAGWDASTGDPIGTGANDHAHIDGAVTNATIMYGSSFNLSGYDIVNITFTWQLDGTWETNEFIGLDFTTNNGTTWARNISTLIGPSAASTVFSTILNTTYLTDFFNLRFFAAVDTATEDGGFDDITVIGGTRIQINTSSWSGTAQKWISREVNATNSNGFYQNNFTTTSRIYGNYSAVAYAQANSLTTRDGSGYDWFTITPDLGGPVIALLYLTNGSTHRSGNFTFNYTADDYANSVANCTIYINNIANRTNFTINETATNSFRIENLSEGRYNWSVRCYDTPGSLSLSANYTFDLDDTAPTIAPIYPNQTTLQTGIINFTFNATDNLDNIMFCNVSVDDGNRTATTNAIHSAITGVLINISTTGLHIWNVTCFDNINNTGYSIFLNFTTAEIPVVNLDSPIDGYGLNNTNITLFYNVTSSSIANCTLILNGNYNQTKNSSEIPFTSNNGRNNFTIENASYAKYNWTVICFDTNNFNDTDPLRNFYLDNEAPIIVLNYPQDNQTLFTRNVRFNFTTTDISDDILTCNLTIDGILNTTGISAPNGTATTQLRSGMSITNHNWSVWCIDNAGFATYSQTFNFTIVSNTSVEITAPANNTFDGDGNMSFSYIPYSTSGYSLGFCELYLDGVSDQTQVAPTEAVTNIFTKNNIASGLHSWYVNCTDDASQVSISQTWTFTVDLANPTVSAITPNGTIFTENIIPFNWSAYDDLAQNLTCTVFVNSTAQSPSVIVPNNTFANRTFSGFTDGLFFWNVTCTDTALRNGTSNTLNFSIREVPRIRLDAPLNNSRTRNQSVIFQFTPFDNSGLLANCTIILDGLRNETNTTSSISAVQRSIVAHNITEGFHNWTANCTDFGGNQGTNTTLLYFTIDRTPPVINQTAPAEGSFLNGNDVTFNWTAIDYTGISISCSLYVDGIFNRTTSSASPATFSEIVLNLSEGAHNWSVNCSDDVGNTNVTGIFNFTINQPDLYINDSRLSLNNTNPGILDTIRIFANVTNIGGIPVQNVLVDFWDGTPGTGIYLGNASGSVNVSENRIFFIDWNITAGLHQIWVRVDPQDLVSELLETNNNATINISTLWVNITRPANNTLTTNQTVPINFTAYDYRNMSINYSIFIDGVLSIINGTTFDGNNTNITLTLSEGLRTIRIEGFDQLGRKKNSTDLIITIDFTAPTATINTANNTWFNKSDPPINFTSTDNTDTLIEYFIHVNTTINVSGNITSGTSLIRQISNYSDGMYIITLQVRDDAGNIRNSTQTTIFIDTTRPTVTLNTPIEGANFTTRNITLNFTTNDNLAPNLTCNITIDSTNAGSAIATNGIHRLFNATNLNEGTHAWNVTCVDIAGNTNTSETRTFNIYNAPIITLNSPANASWHRNTNITFFFNASDETGINNCSLILNGAINETKPGTQITNGVENNITGFGLNGVYIWSIQCYDNSTIPQIGFSNENRTIYVDLENPVPNILTTNGSWYNTASPTITVNITDNMDSPINFSVYANGVLNVNWSAPNASATDVSLSSLINGTYTIFIQAFDEAGNSANSSSITIYIDTVAPRINLTQPENSQAFNATTITFNFTAFDNMAPYLICNLSISNGFSQTNINATNNTNQNFTFSGFVSGIYIWNVTCIDLAGNRNTSFNYNFTINAPDLSINTGNISFNTSIFEEANQIMIYANIFNNGGVGANNITVQFWRGTPYTTGTQINNNITIASLGAGANITVNTTYSPIIGVNNIYIELDPITTFNGTIYEENESNNRANRSFSVSQYHIYSGNLTGIIELEQQTINLSLFDWSVNNKSGSNIFVSDIESNINFYRLHAIGRNITNSSITNDFYEIDLKLGTENLSDSVNRTYTTNNNPINTQNLSVYSKTIVEVPIINSTTNTTVFRTGILWDSADGGIEYNGTQDLVFISEVDTAKQGGRGIYDFEISVPAYMRNYNVAGSTIAFYIELK